MFYPRFAHNNEYFSPTFSKMVNNMKTDVIKLFFFWKKKKISVLSIWHFFSILYFFTFSSEKVFLCKIWQTPPPPPPFLSNVHILGPSEPEKMVFANVSACLYRVIVCSTITFERIDRLDWPLVHLFSVKKWRSSSLISYFCPMVLVLSIKKRFFIKSKNPFSGAKLCEVRKNVKE